MKQKIFLICIIIGIVLIGGCIGSNITDKIPTENLPNSLKLENKFVNKDSVGFVYSSTEGVGIEVGVYELETTAKINYKMYKDYMINIEDFNKNDVNKRNNITKIFNEEVIIIDGLSMKHLQSKVGETIDNKYYAHNVADIYLIPYNNAAIRVGAVEDLKYKTDSLKEYRSIGLEFTKLIIQNLKK